MAPDLIITEATKEVVKSFVENVITPIIKNFAKKCKVNYNDLLIPKGEHFENYLNRMYEKNSIINTLVFHNSQRQLKDVYVAQTLVKEHPLPHLKSKAITIDRLPVELIKEYKKILITDTAGMGKSTMMKRMFIDLIDRGLNLVGIPIYLELNRLNKDRTILAEIQEKLGSLSEKFDYDLLLYFIQKGGFIFFLDGYDEVTIADRGEVTHDIQSFISKAGTKNYYMLTSRPDGNLPSFGDFQSFSIQPLAKDEAYELLNKYDISSNKVLSRKLIGLLRSGRYEALDEYLENPLLVSLLYTAYDFNRSIPFEKHRFYGDVFEAYFEKHDNTKPLNPREKYSGLNQDEFDRILRYVGYDSLINFGSEFNKDTILISIRKAKDFCELTDFSEYDFLKDLVLTVPLFCQDGIYYKWVHKSLSEYFAARFIYCDSKGDQDRILTAIYNSEHLDKYINMLDLYCDIDPKGFSKNITIPLLNKYISFYDNHLFKSKLNDESIQERIGNMFGGDKAFILTESSDIWESDPFTKLSEFLGSKDVYRDQKSMKANIVISSAGRDKNLDALLSLLYEKMPSFFNTMQVYYVPKKLFKDYGICFDQVITINQKTGEENLALYNLYNIIISRNYYLNYTACKIEVEKRNENTKRNDPLSIDNI